MFMCNPGARGAPMAHRMASGKHPLTCPSHHTPTLPACFPLSRQETLAAHPAELLQTLWSEHLSYCDNCGIRSPLIKLGFVFYLTKPLIPRPVEAPRFLSRSGLGFPHRRRARLKMKYLVSSDRLCLPAPVGGTWWLQANRLLSSWAPRGAWRTREGAPSGSRQGSGRALSWSPASPGVLSWAPLCWSYWPGHKTHHVFDLPSQWVDSNKPPHWKHKINFHAELAGAWWDKGLLQHSVVPRGQGLQQAAPSRPSLSFLSPAVALPPSQEEKEAENLGSQRGLGVWWYCLGQTSKLRDSLGVGCWWEEERVSSPPVLQIRFFLDHQAIHTSSGSSQNHRKPNFTDEPKRMGQMWIIPSKCRLTPSLLQAFSHVTKRNLLTVGPNSKGRFINLFIKTFIGHLLCARHWLILWSYTGESNKNLCPHRAYVLESSCHTAVGKPGCSRQWEPKVVPY